MAEFFVSGNNLISKEDWINKINNFRSLNELEDSEVVISQKLKKLFEDSVKRRLENVDEVGICFSGGLDSSYIAALCKKFKANFTCYTVGFQDGQFKDPEDVIEAENVSKFLKLNNSEFKSKIFTIKELDPIIIKTIKILNEGSIKYKTPITNVVTVGVGAVEVAAYTISKKEKVFFSGLGSEEIFAGYDRHKNNPTNEECFNGLINMYERDLLRDTIIPEKLGFKFTTPFLDEKLIDYAMRIPINYKINENGSKMILRSAAVNDLGQFSLRPKRAAQYGSSFDRALLKLAKINGFTKKIDYIKSIK